MGAIIWEFVMKHWLKFGAALVIILGIWFAYAQYTGMQDKIASLSKKNGELTQSITTFKQNELRYQNTIKDQNKKVLELKKASDAAQERMKEAKRHAAEIDQSYQEKITEIQKETVPESCKGAMSYLLKKAREHRK